MEALVLFKKWDLRQPVEKNSIQGKRFSVSVQDSESLRVVLCSDTAKWSTYSQKGGD